MKNEIKKIINNDNGYIKNNDFIIQKLTEKECIIKYEIKKSGLNPLNIVHGGIIFGLADTSAGILASMCGRRNVTTNCTVNFLNKATSGNLYAKSTIIKSGNKIGYYDVVVYDDNKNIVANALVNMFYIE